MGGACYYDAEGGGGGTHLMGAGDREDPPGLSGGGGPPKGEKGRGWQTTAQADQWGKGGGDHHSFLRGGLPPGGKKAREPGVL